MQNNMALHIKWMNYNNTGRSKLRAEPFELKGGPTEVLKWIRIHLKKQKWIQPEELPRDYKLGDTHRSARVPIGDE
jgi:hypothetical protein